MINRKQIIHTRKQIITEIYRPIHREREREGPEVRESTGELNWEKLNEREREDG